MNTTIDEQKLKLALAKLLPDNIQIGEDIYSGLFFWKQTKEQECPECRIWSREVRDTEWLHVCWLIEQTMFTEDDDMDQLYINLLGFCDKDDCYHKMFKNICNAPWQLRAQAICKAKGIEIV